VTASDGGGQVSNPPHRRSAPPGPRRLPRRRRSAPAPRSVATRRSTWRRPGRAPGRGGPPDLAHPSDRSQERLARPEAAGIEPNKVHHSSAHRNVSKTASSRRWTNRPVTPDERLVRDVFGHMCIAGEKRCQCDGTAHVLLVEGSKFARSAFLGSQRSVHCLQPHRRLSRPLRFASCCENPVGRASDLMVGGPPNPCGVSMFFHRTHEYEDVPKNVTAPA